MTTGMWNPGDSYRDDPADCESHQRLLLELLELPDGRVPCGSGPNIAPRYNVMGPIQLRAYRR